MQGQGHCAGKGFPLGVEAQIGFLQGDAVHLGFHPAAEAVQIFAHLLGDILQHKGKVDEFPIAVRLRQSQNHAALLRQSLGVGLVHVGISAHIASHRQLGPAVVELEGPPHQGEALSKGGVDSVCAAQHQKGRRYTAGRNRQALPGETALFRLGPGLQGAAGL